MHVILVDNLRTQRLSQEDFWHSLKCIRCGACMNTCPVYRRSGGLAYESTYSGPIGLILDPGFDEHKYSELPFHSSLCGSCSEVCPVHIDIADQIRKWRQILMKDKETPWSRRVAFEIADEIFGSTIEYRTAQKEGYNAEHILPNDLLNIGPLKAYGLHHNLPEFQKETFREWYQKNRKNGNNE